MCPRRDRSKRYLDLSAEEIGPVTAAIGDMDQVDAGHQLEQLAYDVGSAPSAGRGHVARLTCEARSAF